MPADKVIGIGTDIVECQRIAAMIEKHGNIFLHRVFTEQEIAYCSRNKAATQHYAGRWAAKEAILKAIGTGWARGIQWTDIEVLNEPGGRPSVHLHNAAIDVCHSIGVSHVLISISHTQDLAIAYATAIGSDSN